MISSQISRYEDLENEVDLLSTVTSGNTIIQEHKFSLSCNGEKFFEGDTVFGYFTDEALFNQIGLDGGKKVVPWIFENHLENFVLFNLNSEDFSKKWGKKSEYEHFYLCEGQLSFSDEIRVVIDGGKYNKGYVYARKEVNPGDWFFPYHFYQDPVMPGSLGVEAIIQALQAYALQKKLGESFRSPCFSPVLSKVVWKYRGQIIPTNKYMQLEVHVKKIEEKDGEIVLIADANLWKEDLRIYKISNIVLGISES